MDLYQNNLLPLGDKTDQMKLTTLIENKQAVKQLKCEHGLSFLLQTDTLKILFDTGQSDKFLYNSKILGVDLSDVDYVVLSHGHYDHTGGLPHFLEINYKAKVIVHPSAFKQRFSSSAHMVKDNGVRWLDKLSEYSHRLFFVDEDIELDEGVWVLSNIKPSVGFEVVNERLVTKEGDGYVPDLFSDELVLLAKEKTHPLVICGCAHTGIVNILTEVKQRLDIDEFALVAGGLHLSGQSESEILKVVGGVKQYKVHQWALCHCTGDEAYEIFQKYFGDKILHGASGFTIDIE